MLKKLLLGMLIFVGVCTNMEAEAQAQWHSVESMGTTTSIDLHSVKRQGLLVEAWEQAKQAQASNGSKKVVLHNQYDLDSNKWRNIGSKFYNAQGVTLGQKKVDRPVAEDGSYFSRSCRGSLLYGLFSPTRHLD